MSKQVHIYSIAMQILSVLCIAISLYGGLNYTFSLDRADINTSIGGVWQMLLFFIMLPSIFHYRGKITYIAFAFLFYIVLVNLWYSQDSYTFFRCVYTLSSSILAFFYGCSVYRTSSYSSFLRYLSLIVIIIVSFFLLTHLSFFLHYGEVNRDFIFEVVVYLPFFFLINEKFLKYSGISIILFLVVLSVKRSVILSVVVFLFIYFFLYSTHKTKNFIYILLACSAIVFFISIILPDFYDLILTRFSSIGEDGGSGRDDIYQKIFESFSFSPFFSKLFGHGHDSAFYISNVYAHNDFLELLYDYGIVGVVLFCMFLFSMFPSFRTAFKDSEKIRIRALTIATVVFYILLGVMNCFIYSSRYLTILFFTIGLCISNLKDYNKQNIL